MNIIKICVGHVVAGEPVSAPDGDYLLVPVQGAAHGGGTPPGHNGGGRIIAAASTPSGVVYATEDRPVSGGPAAGTSDTPEFRNLLDWHMKQVGEPQQSWHRERLIAHIDAARQQAREEAFREGLADRLIGEVNREVVLEDEIEVLKKQLAARNEENERLRSSFHQNMLRAYPGKSHAEITSEIERVTATPAAAGTAVQMPRWMMAIHGGKMRMICNPEGAYVLHSDAEARAEEARREEEESTDNWRRLALQFDGHRMSAMGHLKCMVQDPEKHRAQAEAFLSAGPLPGEAILAERIKEIAAAQRTAGEDAVALPTYATERGLDTAGVITWLEMAKEGHSIQHNQQFAYWAAAEILKAQPVPEAAAQADGELLNAICYGVPLTEPVSVAKAMMAQRPAEVVLAGGTGPVSAVHLVNIGVTGWVHTPETAKAYADGFNRAADWLRSAIRSYAAAPTAQPTPNIDPKDLRIDTYSPSPRPQWVNHLDRGISITHVPTGLTVREHDDRSQHRNKAVALEKLRALVAAQPTLPDDERAAFEQHALGAGWSKNDIGEREGDGYSEPFLTDAWIHYRAGHRDALRQGKP